MKKGLLFTIIVSWIVVMIIGVGVTYWMKKEPIDKVTAKVNGTPITEKEFLANLRYKQYANTFTYFNQKYGAEQSENFWTQKFGNETPIEYAREKTLEEITRIKVQQNLMLQNGIVSDISYKGFLEKLKAENERRKEAVRNNKVIYGPEEFGENEYFEYVFNENVEALKRKLAETEFKASENELKKQYQKDKEEIYALPNAITLEVISIPKDAEVGSNNKVSNPKDTHKDQAKALIEKIQQQLNKGTSFETLAKKYNKEKKTVERVLDETSLKRDNPILKEEANKLKVGQVSKILDLGHEGYVIVKCVEVKKDRYKDFNQEKKNIEKSYITEKYNEMIEGLVKQAKIEIIDDVYKKMMP